MRGDLFGGGRDIFKSTPNLMKEAGVAVGAGCDGGVEHGAGGHGTEACVSQATVSTPGSSASERHQAASPVGHG